MSKDVKEQKQEKDANIQCEVCGRFGAFSFGDRHICEECYEGCGSCCPEFGADDLWTFPEEEGQRGGASKSED